MKKLSLKKEIEREAEALEKELITDGIFYPKKEVQ